MKANILFVVSVALFCFNPVIIAEMEDRASTSVIVVHHSATDNGSAESFRSYHKSRGWDDIGYHFVVTNGSGGPDGEIQKGRALGKQGAHAKGRNSNSVGICLVATDKFTVAQQDALIVLLAEMCQKYKIQPSEKTIQRHHEQCPGSGLDLAKIIGQVKAQMKAPK